MASELKDYQEQLQSINEVLELEPTNEEFIGLKNELEELISLLLEVEESGETSLEQTKAPVSASNVPMSAPVLNTQEKIMNNDDDKNSIVHGSSLPPSIPTLPSVAAPPPPPPPKSHISKAPPPGPPPSTDYSKHVGFKVGDKLMARCLTGDKKFHPAFIRSITGSFDRPMYTVKFSDLKTIETVSKECIRVLSPSNYHSHSNNVSSNVNSPPLKAKENKIVKKKKKPSATQKWQQFNSKGMSLFLKK